MIKTLNKVNIKAMPLNIMKATLTHTKIIPYSLVKR